LGVALPSGVALGLAEAVGDSFGDALGVGELFDFFFFFGDALGEDSGDGVGEDFFFFDDAVLSGEADAFGVGDFSAASVGFGVGDFSAADFFFECFRGVGVGVGAKIFFNCVPNDCWAGARAAKPAIAAMAATATAALMLRRIGELLLRQFGQDRLVQPNAAFQILEREIFVRRMGAAVRQCESHQQRLDSQNIAELRDDRNASAFTD